jgi:glycosyltransferase involved in cell wall biosynthesis
MQAPRQRIGLNLLYLRPDEVGGTEVYARGLIAAFKEVEETFDFVVFLNESASDRFGDLDEHPRFTPVVCDPPSNPMLRHVWEQLFFFSLRKRYSIDLLHSLGYVSPLFAGCAQVVTVHDLLVTASPQSIPPAKRIFWKMMIPLSVRRCEAVLTVSETTRSDLLKFVKVAPEKIRVTREGPGQELPPPTPWEEMKTRFGLPDLFFLSVGTDRHKRLDVSTEALAILHSEKLSSAPLVVVGPPRPKQIIRSEQVLKRLGFLSPADLASLYRQAIALVCSSEMEGFGLPLLEAMKSGTPVIAADRGAIAEIVGSAGMLVPFEEPHSLANAMSAMGNDSSMRSELSSKGLMRARQFSWQKCAMETLEVYKSVLQRRQGSTHAAKQNDPPV